MSGESLSGLRQQILANAQAIYYSAPNRFEYGMLDVLLFAHIVNDTIDGMDRSTLHFQAVLVDISPTIERGMRPLLRRGQRATKQEALEDLLDLLAYKAAYVCPHTNALLIG
ncbi:hypothetical protein PRZ48_010348 [Zasmidium cellare]|uniref:Uncharacterized protein n=1 Tax=Zasmidium cellare TaxID=395010 RepID=A0ABR0E8Z0_ZASCE|nr:hypothetical protein PRZ48_010348 [Zasmidium cellare]